MPARWKHVATGSPFLIPMICGCRQSSPPSLHAWTQRAGVTRATMSLTDGGRPRPMSGSWNELQGWIAADVLSTTASVALGTVLMKRVLFNNIGTFNEDPRLVYREDYHLLVRLALAAPVVCVADVLALVRDHPNRLTAQLSHTRSFLRTADVYQKLLPLLPAGELRRIARARRRSQALAACKSAVREGVEAGEATCWFIQIAAPRESILHHLRGCHR